VRVSLKFRVSVVSIILLGVICISTGCGPLFAVIFGGRPPNGVEIGDGQYDFEKNSVTAHISSDSLGSASFYLYCENRGCDTLKIAPATIRIRTRTGIAMQIDSMRVSKENDLLEKSPVLSMAAVSISHKKKRQIFGWFKYPLRPLTVEAINQSGHLPLTIIIDSVGCTGSGQFRRIEITMSEVAQPFRLR
jgi:hypothetical protein